MAKPVGKHRAKESELLQDEIRMFAQRVTGCGWVLTPKVVGDQVRLLAIPEELRRLRRVGIVSSRLGRSFDHWPHWFRALRLAVARMTEGEMIVGVSGTAADSFANRAAELFGKHAVRIELADAEATFADWAAKVQLHAGRPVSRQTPLPLSPPIANAAEGALGQGIPLRDQALFAVCDKIVALHVRKAGFTLQLLQSRLSNARTGTQTLIALGDRLVSKKLRDELMQQGAVGLAFVPTPREDRVQVAASGLDASSLCKSGSNWSGLNRKGSNRKYLTHCTRRRSGAWPSQTDREFLDDLILDRPSAQHSSLDSLKQILESNRLVASSESVRGKSEVVCFTGVPLDELQRLRVFRPHRGRWDFEPYGICIDQECLERMGAAPVSYVQATSSGDNAMEQKSISKTRSGSVIDWTVEQEWRHVGDVAFADVADHEAFVFVNSTSEAREIQTISRWPVVVVGNTE